MGKQHDGRGWMILRLKSLHTGFPAEAIVMECNLTEDAARTHLAALRKEER